MTNEEVIAKLQEIIDVLPDDSVKIILLVVCGALRNNDELSLHKYLVPFAKDAIARIG